MNVNFIKSRKIWYTISLVVLGLGLISMIFQGLNLGIDFTGGTIMYFKFDQGTNATVSDMRQILAQFNLDTASSIVESKEADFEGLIIRTKELQPDQIQEIEAAVKEAYPSSEVLSTEQVGPSIGKDLRWKALLALAIASALILLYISIRFQFKYAVAAIVALLHDAAVILAFFSIFQWEINTPFVAAILTIVGYSINDTIVIFDRIRENVKIQRKVPFADVCNASLLETLPRSINTSFTTLLCVLALLIFGGASIKVFMTALLIGVVAGTYSSLCLAAPLLVTWKNWVTDKA